MTTADTAQPLDFRKISPAHAVLAIAIIAVIALFWDAMGDLWVRWGGQQELSHSYFIPVISAWLVWTNRDVVKASIGDGSFAGAGLGVVAALFFFIGHLTQSYVFQQFGLVVAIAGLTTGFGGLSLLRTTAVPIGFLLFAVPPPFWVITVLSWKFQLMSSVLGVWMIELMGIPVFLSGNVIDLGEYKLQVAEACSGLRYLFPFISLGVMTAYLYRGPIWQKLIIVISTVPITIVMNSFRIAMTGALVQAQGIEHAEGALHFFEGWVVFLLCMIALFAVVAALAFLQNPRKGPLDALGTADLPLTKPKAGGVDRKLALGGLTAAAVVAMGGAQLITVDQFITPDRQDFDLVVNEFPDWQTSIRPMDASVAEVLGADDSIVINMLSPEKEYVNLYFAYLNARRDGRSWHSPRQCIPGGGWEIASHDIVERQTVKGQEMHFNRLLIQNRDNRQLVYYWYDQRGRRVANEFVMKFWLIWDAIFKKRSDGAMIRVLTHVNNEEAMADADARLVSMMEQLDTILPAYVPE